MILPWRVDVPEDRWPVINWLIIAGIVVVFAFQEVTVRKRVRQVLLEYQRTKEQVPEKQLNDMQKAEEQPTEEQLAELREKLGKKIFGPVWLFFCGAGA